MLLTLEAPFILDVRDRLQSSYAEQLSYNLLKILADAGLGDPPAGTLFDVDDPRSSSVRAHFFLVCSFVISFTAAFIAVLGFRVLDHYAEAEMRGFVSYPGLGLQRKMDAMATWHFGLFMKLPMYLIQTAFIFLGGAFLRYFFLMSTVVVGIIFGSTISLICYIGILQLD
jgi:hypothetical protein